MNILLHKANERGHANHGWLNAYHSFSFAGYYNPKKTHFGVLRVLNDDTIAGGKGFGMHPHDNMEIITIPLSGSLMHKDSIGNTGVVKYGEVQVMSAGSGITHSEHNNSEYDDLKLLQIWLFPKVKNVTPRYDQIQYNLDQIHNNWLQIISPNADDEGTWIHQDAWFHLGQFSKDGFAEYELKKEGNGLYVFVISGHVDIADVSLQKRDAVGITNLKKTSFKFQSDTLLLLMELPMEG